MTITFQDIKSEVKRHLSIIGKRMYSKDGQNLFSQITVSSAEDPIFEQYICAAAQNVESMLMPLVGSFAPLSSHTVGFTFKNTRGSMDFDSRCGEMVKTYITLFTVGEYLAMTHPELAEKYYRDATNAIQSLMAYAYHKDPPK